jgi:hypothetical protein
MLLWHLSEGTEENNEKLKIAGIPAERAPSEYKLRLDQPARYEDDNLKMWQTTVIIRNYNHSEIKS